MLGALEVVFATSNPGKVREVSLVVGDALTLRFCPMWLESEETSSTYLENALSKARAAVHLTGIPVLAEDAGIEVDAFGGLPGVRSARFAGVGATDALNNAKLVRLLAGVVSEARYRAVAVLCFPSGYWVSGSGTFEGTVSGAARGSGGFGYDPHFTPLGYERTAAELSLDEKAAISHRTAALRALLARL